VLGKGRTAHMQRLGQFVLSLIVTTYAPNQKRDVVFDQEPAVPDGLAFDNLRPESPGSLPARRGRLTRRFTVALASVTTLLLVAAALAVVFHSDATSTHARLRSTQHELSSTQSQLHTTEGTLHDTQNTLDSTQRELVTAREEASSAQSNAAQSKDVINSLRSVHDQVVTCVNAWSDFANGFLNRLVVENNALVPSIVATCNAAIAADTALVNQLNSSSA